MNPRMISDYKEHSAPPPVLIATTQDPIAMAHQLEAELQDLIKEVTTYWCNGLSPCFKYRHENRLSTRWSDHMSYILSPALTAYEMERTFGVSVGNEEFQHIVKRSTPIDSTFKVAPSHFRLLITFLEAFPIQFTHTDARRILRVCKSSDIGVEVLLAKGVFV